MPLKLNKDLARPQRVVLSPTRWQVSLIAGDPGFYSAGIRKVADPHNSCSATPTCLRLRLLLYVDGRLSATAAYAGSDWNADGAVQIGRRLFRGTYSEYADGSVSGVRVYPAALPAANAAATGSLPGITELD
ncbi:hypothetical protein KMT30_00840 [Streptomyces sp. IBSBF 2953]|nr:hypothetical protein [Streptomyces hayashii]